MTDKQRSVIVLRNGLRIDLSVESDWVIDQIGDAAAKQTGVDTLLRLSTTPGKTLIRISEVAAVIPRSI